MTVTDQKKLRPRQVAAYQSLRPVMVDESATCGAQIGVNLLMPDGTVGTLAQLVKLFGGTASSDNGTLTTTDDLEEGQWNLWFTNRRAQDAVGSILVNSANVTLAYAAGTITANLTPITFGGSGSLYAFTFDTYGRVVDYRTPSTDDLAEGTNLYFTAARVLAAVLTGLSLVTSAVISATDTVLGAFGKLQAQITDNLLPPGYIDGLKMVWVSGTALTVTTGSAYIPSLGKVLRVTTDIAKTSLSLSTSTWYHVYLYSNAGTPDVELSTTAPAAAYSGTARSKTGDISRRYLGSILSDTSGNVINFAHGSDGFVVWRIDTRNAPFRCLSAGVATAITTVSLSTAVPVTANTCKLNCLDTDTTAVLLLGNSLQTGFPIHVIRPLTGAPVAFPIDGSQAMQYAISGAISGGGAAFIDVLGYGLAR